ncbi:MAG: aminoacyl-tRNA hydrolase [Chloroflexi bacterium]|nr:aminoacyl-tRNA hydrolase [Chloroflexota bacterium]
MSEIYLIVGLGNPGAKYEATRHNVGFTVVDELARRHRLGAGRSEKRALTWDGRIGARRVKLAKPLTYMNRSGESVRQLSDYYKIARENLLIVHDDLDTPFGALRLRWNGGHGGQKGLRNIVRHLGDADFARLRFGIGRPPGRMDPVHYVLQAFRGDDAIRAEELAARAADAIEVWLSDGLERAMSQYNGNAAGGGRRDSKPDLSEQLVVFARAHELAPRDPKPLIKLIALQKKLGQIDAAVANHLKLAQLYECRGQSEQAIAEKSKAVAIRPGLVAMQREIAEWYLAQDNKKKAVSRYLILAQHLREAGDSAAALDVVSLALAINPQHPKALDMRRALDEASEPQA